MPRYTINPQYGLEQLVYLRSDLEKRGYIVGIILGTGLVVSYMVRISSEEIDEFFEYELTDTRDYQENG